MLWGQPILAYHMCQGRQWSDAGTCEHTSHSVFTLYRNLYSQHVYVHHAVYAEQIICLLQLAGAHTQ